MGSKGALFVLLSLREMKFDVDRRLSMSKQEKEMEFPKTKLKQLLTYGQITKQQYEKAMKNIEQ